MNLQERYSHCCKTMKMLQDLVNELEKIHPSIGSDYDAVLMINRIDRYNETIEALNKEAHYCELVLEYNQDHSW